MMESFSPVLILGLLFSGGFLLGLGAEKIGLPRIVGYIFIGILFSEDVLGGLLQLNISNWAPQITDIALGIIAYIVGAEINLHELKKQGRPVLYSVAGQTVGVLLLVSFGLYFSNHFFHFVDSNRLLDFFIFGTIATATAPATTIGIIDEYRAKGKLTNIILGVIAIDDALGIALFALFIGLAGDGSLAGNLMDAAGEIAGALIVGGVLGYALGMLGKRIKMEQLRLAMIIGFIFLGYGISEHFHLSSLLSCMMLGFVSKSFNSIKQADWLTPLEHIEELVFLFFFTLAGAYFELSTLIDSLTIVLIYVVLRVSGKYFGAYGFNLMSNLDKKLQKLVGLCLFPQAGVAIGLAVKASHEPALSEISDVLLNTIIGTTLIFAIASPFSTRFALKKANEIK